MVASIRKYSLSFGWLCHFYHMYTHIWTHFNRFTTKHKKKCWMKWVSPYHKCVCIAYQCESRDNNVLIVLLFDSSKWLLFYWSFYRANYIYISKLNDVYGTIHMSYTIKLLYNICIYITKAEHVWWFCLIFMADIWLTSCFLSCPLQHSTKINIKSIDLINADICTVSWNVCFFL